MNKKRLYLIDGIYYQLNPIKLKKALEKAKDNYRNNKTGKGDFWSDLEKNCGRPPSTVRGWCKGSVPQDKEELLKLIGYLRCDINAVLEPVATSGSDINTINDIGDKAVTNVNEEKEKRIKRKTVKGDNIPQTKERLNNIVNKKKELNIGFFPLISYLAVIKGYEISIVILWMILRGKIMPSDGLCTDMEELFSIIENNRRCDKVDAVNHNHIDARDLIAKRCIASKIRMQQLRISYRSTVKYLAIIKNYQLNMIDFLKLLNGLSIPTDTFLCDLETFLAIVAENTMDDLFPLLEEDKNYDIKDIKINQSCMFATSIPIVFTVGTYRTLKRDEQIRRIRNYAKGHKIALCNTYMHTTRDTDWFELKKAFSMVENGYYDTILLNKSGDFESPKFRNRVTQYAINHNIPIVYVEEQYYIK